jgi:hypothetical protein
MPTPVEMLREVEKKSEMFTYGMYAKPTRQARLNDSKLSLCDEKGALLKAVRCGNIDQRCHEDCAWFSAPKTSEYFFCFGLPIALIWSEDSTVRIAKEQIEYDLRVKQIAEAQREARKENFKSSTNPRKKTKPKKEPA